MIVQRGAAGDLFDEITVAFGSPLNNNGRAEIVVLGYHLLLSAYGFWLPNDPRGSWSQFVRAQTLLPFGSATKVDSTRSVAAKPHDRKLRFAAKTALKYNPVHFTGFQALAIGNGFGEFAKKSGLTIWACSILPTHAHLVIARHRYPIEQIAILLKGAATRRLLSEGLHPFGRDAEGKLINCWSRGEWAVFLDSVNDVIRSIEYAEDNPTKEGKPRQRWRFVTPYIPV